MSHARDGGDAKRMKVLAIYGGGDLEGRVGRPGFRIGWDSVFGNPNDNGGVARVETYGFAVCCLTLSRLKPVLQNLVISVGRL